MIKKIVAPHIRRFVKKPDICGISPGWADTIRSMPMHLPGALSLSLQIEPWEPFWCHGFWWDVQKMYDMQIDNQCLSEVNFLLILLYSARWIMAENGRWFILQFKPINSHWLSSRISGFDICSIYWRINLGSLVTYCSMVTGIVPMSGVSIDERRMTSTNKCHLQYKSCASTLCQWCVAQDNSLDIWCLVRLWRWQTHEALKVCWCHCHLDHLQHVLHHHWRESRWHLLYCLMKRLNSQKMKSLCKMIYTLETPHWIKVQYGQKSAWETFFKIDQMTKWERGLNSKTQFWSPCQGSHWRQWISKQDIGWKAN